MSIRGASASGSFEAANDYQNVPASTTTKLTGQNGVAGGAQGDYIKSIVIVPSTTSPGAVTLQDGNGSAMTIFAGGAASVQGLVPIWIDFSMMAMKAPVAGAAGWTIVTGANMNVIVVGDFQ